MPHPPARILLLLLLLPSLLTLGGCNALGMAALHTANAASIIGNYDREADLAYGPDACHRLDIYTPRRGFEGPRPVIVFFHGGDWSEQYPDKDLYKFVGEALASRGFVAVLANYRRYPSVRFPAFVKDAAEAVAWTYRHIEQYEGDPDALFVMGHSAGAHLASMVALNERYLIEAGGDPSWVRGLVGLAGPYSFLPMPDDPLLKDLFGPPERYPLSQPVNYVDRDAPPMLLLSGGKDKRVPAVVMHRLEHAVQAHGGEVRSQTYPGLDHVMLIGSLAMPVRWSEPVIDDVAQFVHEQATHDPGPRTVRAHNDR